MTKHTLDLPATLRPIEGGYQKDVSAVVVRDTPTMWVVIQDGKHNEEKYSKETMFKIGAGKNDFPRRKLIIT